MARAYTSDELLVSIRNLGMIPDATSTGTTDADLLRHASEAMMLEVMPEVLKFREEYFVLTARIAMSANVSRYRIPKRAAGNRLRDVQVFRNGTRRRIPLITREDLLIIAQDGEPSGYYLEGNHIVVHPATNASGDLEVSFYFSPPDLVLQSAARQVTVVVSPTVLEVGSAFPTAFTTSKKFDIHGPESGAEIRNYNLSATTIAAVAPFRITFTAAVDGTIFGTDAAAVGDWIVLEREAVVAPIPRELNPLLVRATCAAVMEALGYADKMAFHEGKLRKNVEALKPLLNSRVESRPLVITGRDSVLDLGRRY